MAKDIYISEKKSSFSTSIISKKPFYFYTLSEQASIIAIINDKRTVETEESLGAVIRRSYANKVF